MRRYICLCIVFAAVVLLTGCFRLNIDMGIDERFTSFLSYSVEMDMGEVDPQYHDILANALNNFGWYYQEDQGFGVAIDTDSDIYKLTMRKSVNNESFTEAFESLKAMLTDEEITAFMMVDMSLESYPRVDSYIVSAMLDMPQIMKLSSAQELPPDLLEALEKGLETSGGTVVLTLPVSEVFGSSHEVEEQYGLAVMTAPFDFSSQTGLELRGSVIYSEDGTQIGAFDEVINDAIYKREIALMAFGSAFALLLIIMLASLIKIRKHNKLYD